MQNYLATLWLIILSLTLFFYIVERWQSFRIWNYHILFHRYYWHLSFLGLVSFEILFLIRHISITHLNLSILIAIIALTLISSSILYSLALCHKLNYYKILGLLATLQIFIELYFFPYMFPGQVNFIKTATSGSVLILLAITVLSIVIGVYTYVQRFYYKRFRISNY